MSMQTWKEEFYPVTADEISETGTALEIAEHSLKKWEGLRKDNMDRHDIHKHDGVVQDVYVNGDIFVKKLSIDASSCSLCQKYHSFRCNDCPIKRIKETKTSNQVFGEACSHEFRTWQTFHEPEPMIKLLTEVVFDEQHKDIII